MSTADNTSATDISFPPQAVAVPQPVQFWTYLVFDTLSVPCCLFVLYHLLFARTLRRALNNHVIVVLLLVDLVYEFTYIPWNLYHIRYGMPWIQSPVFYLFTYYFDYGCYSAHISLFCWATVERHILIFHNQWMSTWRKRLLVHYVPIGIILVYRLVYFTVVLFHSSCANLFDLFVLTGTLIPCVFDRTTLGTFELILHQVVPTVIIVSSTVILTVRVLSQKRRLRRRVSWRKHRKMTIQLLSISALYFVFNSPWTIGAVSLQGGLSMEVGSRLMPYVVYFRAYVIFLFPYVCLGSSSELRGKLKRISRGRILKMFRMWRHGAFKGNTVLPQP